MLQDNSKLHDQINKDFRRIKKANDWGDEQLCLALEIEDTMRIYKMPRAKLEKLIRVIDWCFLDDGTYALF